MSPHIPADHGLEQIYDQLATTYAENRGAFDISEILEGFLARLGPDGHLLDLGCGAGEPVATTFLGRGWRVTGVDISAGMLRLASTYASGMDTVRADIRDVRFPSGSFDAVTAVYSLFHVPAADHPALFGRVRDWLRPGGRMLFTYATRDYTGQERFDGTIRFLGHDLYYSHVAPGDLGRQLRGAGLAVEESVDRFIGGETFRWVTARRN